MIADEVSARRRYQRGQPAQELARFEHQHLGAIGEGALQEIGEASVSELRQSRLHERRTGAVPAKMSEAFPVVGVEVHAGVQRESVLVGSPFLLPAPVRWPPSERAHRVGLRGSERVPVA